jgi:isocitrate lyase
LSKFPDVMLSYNLSPSFNWWVTTNCCIEIDSCF